MDQQLAVVQREPEPLAVASPTAAAIIAGAGNALDAFERMGEALVKSGVLGNIERPSIGTVVAMVCFEEQMSVTRFVNTYDVIGGKIRRKASSAHAEFRRRGGRIEWVGDLKDGTKQAAKVHWEGRAYDFDFTIEDARNAKMIKAGSAWDTNPADMLRSKVIGKIILALCPEIYGFAEEPDAQQAAPATNSQAAEALVNFGNRPTPMAPTAAPPPAAPKPANVAEVRTVPTTPAPQPAPAPRATPPPQPAPAPAPAAPAEAFVELSPERQEKLAAAIGAENVADAVHYLRAINWLKPEQSIETLEWKYAGPIVNNPPAFAQRLANYKAKVAGGAK